MNSPVCCNTRPSPRNARGAWRPMGRARPVGSRPLNPLLLLNCAHARVHAPQWRACAPRVSKGRSSSGSKAPRGLVARGMGQGPALSNSELKRPRPPPPGPPHRAAAPCTWGGLGVYASCMHRGGGPSLPRADLMAPRGLHMHSLKSHLIKHELLTVPTSQPWSQHRV